MGLSRRRIGGMVCVMPDTAKRTAKKTAKPPGKHPLANSGSFGIGRDPLERLSAAAEKVIPDRVEVEGTGLLRDYRFVWENDKAHDDTPKRKTLRRMLAQDPRGFVKDMNNLEKANAVQASGGAGKPEAAVERGSCVPPDALDLGTERCLELVDRLLAGVPS